MADATRRSAPAPAQGRRRTGRRPRRQAPAGRRRVAAGRQPPPPPADPKYNWPKPQTVLGTSVKRLDGPDKVTGRRSTPSTSRVPACSTGASSARRIRTRGSSRSTSTAAQRAPGVKAAIVWRDPANAQRNTVMYQGDEVAAVAADTEEHAIDAARLVKVEYEVLPHVISRRSGAGRATRRRCSRAATSSQGQAQETGDLAAGFKQAAFTVEQTYATHVITHVCLESHGAVCEWDGDHLTAWVSTQGISAAREGFASGAEHPAGQRPRDHAVHGRRLRQQARRRTPQGLICARAGQGGEARRSS